MNSAFNLTVIDQPATFLRWAAYGKQNKVHETCLKRTIHLDGWMAKSNEFWVKTSIFKRKLAGRNVQSRDGTNAKISPSFFANRRLERDIIHPSVAMDKHF